MLAELNRVKQNVILREDAKFFQDYRNTFTKSFADFLKENSKCKCCVYDKNAMARNFYDALFDYRTDCFEKNICCMTRLKKSSKNAGFEYSNLIYDMVEAYMEYTNGKAPDRVSELLHVCSKFQKSLIDVTEEKPMVMANVTPHAKLSEPIKYFENVMKLGRGVRFLTHNQLGTCTHTSHVRQVGKNSVVIDVGDEQMSMINSNHSAFVLKNSEDEKNFSCTTRILCIASRTIVLENIKELDIVPLLSRKYPRAHIVHASLVHIANENEYISGNMVDISQGGIGIMSSSKSHFEKGQDIVAFVSYEDEDHGFKFSFEATGIVTSIIGKENAFRYGIQLHLSEEEKETINNLITILNG